MVALQVAPVPVLVTTSTTGVLALTFVKIVINDVSQLGY
jgi:hypothetical protein